MQENLLFYTTLPEGVAIPKILKLHQKMWLPGFDSRHKLINESIILFSGSPWLAQTPIHGVRQEGLVVGACKGNHTFS
jgi:hypothetical protein